MVQTKFLVVISIFESVWNGGGWGGNYSLETIAEAGCTLIVTTNQTADNSSNDNGVDLLYSNGVKMRSSFEVLGRYLACGAIKQID